MKKQLLILLALAAVAGCTNEDHASRALRSAGYKQFEFTGWSPFGCSDTDQFATGFRGIGPSGAQVEGVVCSGVLKGATIRTD